jgi:hypothetical protein
MLRSRIEGTKNERPFVLILFYAFPSFRVAKRTMTVVSKQVLLYFTQAEASLLDLYLKLGK